VDPTDGWQFVVADVIGNGRADVLGYHPSNGTVWVGENRGNGFTLTRRGSAKSVTCRLTWGDG
jgi:hypothetical protein